MKSEQLEESDFQLPEPTKREDDKEKGTDSSMCQDSETSKDHNGITK